MLRRRFATSDVVEPAHNRTTAHATPRRKPLHIRVAMLAVVATIATVLCMGQMLPPACEKALVRPAKAATALSLYAVVVSVREKLLGHGCTYKRMTD